MKTFTFTRATNGTIDFTKELARFAAESASEKLAVDAHDMPAIDAELYRRALAFSNVRKKGMADAWDALIEASKLEGTDEHALVKAHFAATLDLVKRHEI